MASYENEEAPPEKRLTAEELEKQVGRLTAPRREVEWRDPFEVCPTKRISQDALAKMTDRLYTQSIQHKQEQLAAADQAAYGAYARGPAHSAAPMSPDDVEQSVKRLYTETLEKKERSMAQLREQHRLKRRGSDPKVPLNTFVQHMYYDRLEAKKKTAKKLYDTYIATTEIQTGTISRAQADEVSSRLCTTK